MECKDILNLIAIVVIPIAAVLIGQHLQNRAEIRKDKMHIFKVLMTSRIYGWTVDSVHALNLIDVVFAKDKAVRAAWKELYEAYSSTEQSDLMANKRKNLMYKLLEEIAKNIGYKKKSPGKRYKIHIFPRVWSTNGKSKQHLSRHIILC